MATSILTNDAEDHQEIIDQLNQFPNLLSIESSARTSKRLQSILYNVLEEVKSGDACLEEIIYKLNFQTWAYINLGQLDQAVKINEEVISKTGMKNIISITHSTYLNWKYGNEIERDASLKQLKSLVMDPASESEACGEIAYVYARLGTPMDLHKSIQLFEKILLANPLKYLWKLRLGLTYRRAARPDIFACLVQYYNPSLKDYVKKSKELLWDVSQNCNDNILRAPAFAELAVLCVDCHELLLPEVLGNMDFMFLCDEALKFGSKHAWVLADCGRLLRDTNVDKSALLLKLSAELRPNTTVYHHLGLCYRDMAKKQMQSNDDCPYVQMATEAFEKAIKLSHSENLPAIFDLGILYMDCQATETALKTFNQITNSGSRKRYLQILILAYEKAGQCYLQMEECKDRADEKFKKAISLSASLVSCTSELKTISKSLWQSFRTLSDKIAVEAPSPARDKKVIGLFQLVKDHKDCVGVLQSMLELSDDKLDDPEIIKAKMEFYMAQEQYEDAVLVLNLAKTRISLTSCEEWTSCEMIALQSSVLLATAFSRLQKQSGDARDIFQQLFQLGYRDRLEHRATNRTNESSIVQGDVLIFYYSKVEETSSHDPEEAENTYFQNSLQKILSQEFGLTTSKNLENCNVFGKLVTELQLEEFFKYHLVMIVLGDEQGSTLFRYLLNLIPLKDNKSSTKTTFLLLDTRQDTEDVWDSLKQYRSIKLRDILSSREMNKTKRELIIKNVQNDPNALIKFFSFIIGKT